MTLLREPALVAPASLVGPSVAGSSLERASSPPARRDAATAIACPPHGSRGSSGASPAAPREPAREGASSLTSRAMLAVLRFYQRRLSPLKGAPSCRYLPTCSEYAVQAVRRHGAVKGAALAAARIARCNPFFHAGYHPVPEAGRWATCEHEGSH